MIQLIVTIGGVLAAVVALIDLVRYLQDSEHRDAIRIVGNITILAAITGYIAYFSYFGPKAAGDKYVDALRTFNGSGMVGALCEDSPEYDDHVATAGLIDLGGALFRPQMVIDSNSFLPFANEMRVTYHPVSLFSVDNAENLVLTIRPNGPFSFCVWSTQETVTGDVFKEITTGL